MKKDIARTDSSRAERMPASKRTNFFAPMFNDFMNPTRWFDDYMNPARMFDDNFGRELSQLAGADKFLAPAIDVDETANEYIVSADLPGIKKEDINVECSGNQLTISAERKYESDDGRKHGRRERFYGTYQRSFTLPAGVDADKIEASFDNGELKVHVPKGEQAKGKRIQIGEAKAPQKDAKH